MRDVAITAAAWILVALLLAVIGLLIVTGLGRTRGTPLYRLRMKLWKTAVAAAAGAGIVLGAGCANRSGVPDAGFAAPDVGSIEATEETPAAAPVPDGSGEEEAAEDAAGDAIDDATAKPDAADGVSKKKPRVPAKRCYAMVSGGDTVEYKAAVKKIISKNKGPIERCYKDALATQPGLKGRIVVQFAINPTGTVQAASIKEDGVGSPDLAACVLSEVRKLKFPMPEGGLTIISHPFVFNPPK
jgi:TonB family protein